MQLKVLTIAEEVEIDYNHEYLGDTVRRTGKMVATLVDSRGHKYAVCIDGLSVDVGDTVNLEIL